MVTTSVDAKGVTMALNRTCALAECWLDLSSISRRYGSRGINVEAVGVVSSDRQMPILADGSGIERSHVQNGA